MSRFAHAAAKNKNIKSREPERHEDESTLPVRFHLVEVDLKLAGPLERIYVKGYDDEPVQ